MIHTNARAVTENQAKISTILQGVNCMRKPERLIILSSQSVFTRSPLRIISTVKKHSASSFFADIATFEAELHSEIEKIELFDKLPTKWTYPQIQPLLLKEVERRILPEFIMGDKIEIQKYSLGLERYKSQRYSCCF